VGQVGERDERLHRRELWGELLHQRRQTDIEEEMLVVGMADHVADLLGEEPGIHRVEHRAHPRDTEEELHVPVAVPGHAGDPVPPADPQPGQRLCELPRPAIEVEVGAAMRCHPRRQRDDLGVRVRPRRMFQQRGDEERMVLHQSAHGL